MHPAESGGIPVLIPASGGHSFLWYGDSCSGQPDHANTANFAAINDVFQRLAAMPDHVIFAGDAIMGGEADADTHRRQWRHWLDREMAWFWPLGIPLYQIPSNHNTATALAEAIFRETFPGIPTNGPIGQERLSYWVRRDDLLLVFVNTNFSGLGGAGHVEHTWLDKVLDAHADAAHKVVIGHHPIHPVNGYTFAPLWCVVPEEGRLFWEVLVRHRVLAYVCSHILAFDVQVHEGVLQILTGGAGTHDMRLGLMPEGPEYFHLVQGAIDADGLRYIVLDTTGTVRERLQWPLPDVDDREWRRLVHPHAVPLSAGEGWIAHFRIRGIAGSAQGEQTLLAGWQRWEGPLALWIGLSGNPQRLAVQLVPEPGRGAQRWDGPALPPGSPIDAEVVIHSGMGPGGVLIRFPGGGWSSFRTSANRGAEHMAWPEEWAVGHGQRGTAHSPFRGEGLAVDWRIQHANSARPGNIPAHDEGFTVSPSCP